MTRLTFLFAPVVIAAVVLASGVTATAAGQTPPAQKLDIAVKTTPSPAVHGDNKFEVTVKDAAGKPVTDVDVALQLVMPAMPGMGEMKTDVKLKVEDDKFVGTGQLGMSGTWNVAVTVKKDGKTLAEQKSKLPAK
jgi:nitrogen fixation protein FixH